MANQIHIQLFGKINNHNSESTILSTNFTASFKNLFISDSAPINGIQNS